ncbi:MAG: OmpA family protein [Candidatus Omnitrophica bacterium]|nr:OmpA family protein [Candidatus Omnitrophota bacterium]
MRFTPFQYGIAAALLLAGLTGCGVNFYAGRPTDVRKIHELSSELERLRMQKQAENDQLREAKEMLERQLKKEIADRQVKLEMAERGLVLTFVAEVLFDSGKTELKSKAQEALSKVASVIREKVADRDVGIEGHTDNEPIKVSGWKSNWELSTARATSVLHFLDEEGVDPSHLVASGYGEYRPVDSSDSLEGRRKNRRVEIVILPKELTKRERDLIRRGEMSGEPELVEKARSLEQYK